MGQLQQSGEMPWFEGERLHLKHLGSSRHMVQLVLVKGSQGFCSPAFGRAVVSSHPAQTAEAFRSEQWRTPALLISKSLKYCK